MLVRQFGLYCITVSSGLRLINFSLSRSTCICIASRESASKGVVLPTQRVQIR
jgi:hypothetical protein